jgi:hypothetical protein
VDEIETHARATGHWAVPGNCSVHGCGHPRVFPTEGLCPTHARLVDDFTRWLAFGVFDLDRQRLETLER